MLETVRRLASLSRSECLLLAATTILLPSGRVLLALVGLERTRRILDRLVAVLPPYARVRDPDRVPWAIDVVDAYLPIHTSCLPRAVVGERLFTANGYSTRIHLGVAKDEGFEAHAWVERDGEIVIGEVDEHARFQPLYSYCPR